MLVEHIKNTTIVTQEKATLEQLITKLTDLYEEIKNDNLIINLFSLNGLKTAELNEFLLLARKHNKSKHSFVIVANKIKFDDVPEELMVVPSLKEAYDIIEMEEIERDLGF